MKKLRRLISLALVALSVSTVSFSALAAAATSATNTATGSGIKLLTVRKDLTVNPGTSQTVTITIQNVTNATTTYQAIVNDFTVQPGNETGQPDLILDPNQYAPSHSLKRFIAPIGNVTLAPNQQTDVKVTITVPKDAAGGGYFGAVRFAPIASGANNQNVTLSASAGTILLVKVPGNIRDQLSIVSFDVRKFNPSNTEEMNTATASGFHTSNKSLNAVVRFQNSGNVQEQPFGKITLKKGKTVVQTTEVNNTDPRGNVLPNSIRRFSVPLDKLSGWGKFTLEGNFGYGGNGQLLSATSTFYVVPVSTIVLAVVVMALVLFAIFGLPRVVRAYNRRVLRNAGRR